jgi:hypothetical protein
VLSYGDREATKINGKVTFKASAASPSAGRINEIVKVHEVECNDLDRLKVTDQLVKNFSVFNKPYSYM